MNKEYTFENFVIDDNNKLAYEAAAAVAEAPATVYNPLFLYGEVGLGKTHLMYAIGNKVKENNKNANVLYVTSENFTKELISAIKDDIYKKFINKYKSIDILLIDDIQFIAGKERIQEEFLHIFNSLYENRKQIIISSNRSFFNIPSLENKLKSSFELGFAVNISMPDYESRMEILKRKRQLDSIAIEDERLSIIASNIKSSVRDLIWVLNETVAIASLNKTPITTEVVEKVINDNL